MINKVLLVILDGWGISKKNNDSAIFHAKTEFIDSLYNTIDEKFLEVVDGYAQGINRYAELNSNEVLVPKLFPITPKKMLKYSFL